MFEGMPWPIAIPIALMAMAYGIMISKRELKEERKADEERHEK